MLPELEEREKAIHRELSELRAEAKLLRRELKQPEMKTLFDRSVTFGLDDAGGFLIYANRASRTEGADVWLIRAEIWVTTARMRMNEFSIQSTDGEIP